MEVYKIDSSNVASAFSKLQEKEMYFIITVDVKLSTDISIGKNSVLDFRGGSFSSSSGPVTVTLQNNPIQAGPFPIFKDNITVVGLSTSEVKAEWFRWSTDESDADYINRALIAADVCTVVLEPKTYNLKKSIKFPADTKRHILICPGTLSVNMSPGNVPSVNDIAAIEVNTQVVTLKINKIEGTDASYNAPDASPSDYCGIGIKFTVYTDHSDIEVNTMSKLHMGFCVLPDMLGTHPDNSKDDIGGVQYTRFKFGSILADYCFYIDVFSKAQYECADTGNVVKLTEIDDLSKAKLTPLNWFNENQIYGELMQGKYGIYVLDANEFDIVTRNVGKGCSNVMNPDNVSNALNGLLYENISFEKITVLPIRLRSVNRSCFYNLQMFNSLPGDNPVENDDYTTWIDLENIKEVRMSFTSFVVPTHIKVGNNCRKSYIYGAVLDKPSQYISHYDTLGIDMLNVLDDDDQLIPKSQMFVTCSTVPFNMTKVITADEDTTLYVKDLLPSLEYDVSSENIVDLPVLPAALDVDIKVGKILTIDLTGFDGFAPCLYTINVNLSADAILRFRTTDSLEIAGGVYHPAGHAGVTSLKDIVEGGIYTLQWLSNRTIQIKRVVNS